LKPRRRRASRGPVRQLLLAGDAVDVAVEAIQAASATIKAKQP
jgi:hypothetical protein